MTFFYTVNGRNSCYKFRYCTLVKEQNRTMIWTKSDGALYMSLPDGRDYSQLESIAFALNESYDSFYFIFECIHAGVSRDRIVIKDIQVQ